MQNKIIALGMAGVAAAAVAPTYEAAATTTYACNVSVEERIESLKALLMCSSACPLLPQRRFLHLHRWIPHSRDSSPVRLR